MRSVHFPEMISAQQPTGQGFSAIEFTIERGVDPRQPIPKAEYSSMLYELK
jgi:hypothetical protein